MRLFIGLSFLLISACTVDPFSSILYSAVHETRREAENNYLQAKQLETDGLYQDAFWMMRRAANGRYGRAAYELGNYYVEGTYIPKNYILARHYYFIAVYEMDLKAAYIQLAEIDFYGKQKPRATQLGYKWMLVGTRGDTVLRKKMKLKMDSEMKANQIAKAQKSADVWIYSRNFDPSIRAAE